MFTATAYGNRIIVKKIETTAKKVGSIFLPDTAEDPKNNVYLGRVMAKGPDADKETVIPVEVGDIVQYQRDGSFPHVNPFDSIEYSYVRAGNVWGGYGPLSDEELNHLLNPGADDAS